MTSSAISIRNLRKKYGDTVALKGIDIDIKDGFKLREDWINIDNYEKNELALCKENSAVFALNNNPIHLTDYKIIEDELWLKGHSLMNGYFEKDKMAFKDEYLIIKKE